MAMTDATALGSPNISLSIPCINGVCLAHSPKSYPCGIFSRVVFANAVDIERRDRCALVEQAGYGGGADTRPGAGDNRAPV